MPIHEHGKLSDLIKNQDEFSTSSYTNGISGISTMNAMNAISAMSGSDRSLALPSPTMSQSSRMSINSDIIDLALPSNPSSRANSTKFLAVNDFHFEELLEILSIFNICFIFYICYDMYIYIMVNTINTVHMQIRHHLNR